MLQGRFCYAARVDGEGSVKKGYHCARQIHYHIVFPVEYRKSLLDEEVVRIVRETAVGIEERYEIEMETMGMDKDHIHLLRGAHPKLSPLEGVLSPNNCTADRLEAWTPLLFSRRITGRWRDPGGLFLLFLLHLHGQ